MGSNGILWDLPEMVNIEKTMERSTLFNGDSSTISTGSFSIANCKRLPEGSFGTVHRLVSEFFHGKVTPVFTQFQAGFGWN